MTFARGDDALQLLPEAAEGASGWMIAIADDARDAHALLVQDLQRCGFEELVIEQVQPTSAEDIVDEHLAANLRDLETGKRTVWGTIHVYY